MFNLKKKPAPLKSNDAAAILTSMTYQIGVAAKIESTSDRKNRFNQIEKQYKPKLPKGAARRLVDIARAGTGIN